MTFSFNINKKYKIAASILSIVVIGTIIGIVLSISYSSKACICNPGNFCSNGKIKKCPPGSYCPDSNMTEPTDCPEGYYCPTPTTSIICPIGYYCPRSCLQEEYCSFSNRYLPCLKGSYCPNLGNRNPIKCPIGYYCGGGSDINRCPVGKTSPIQSSSITQCVTILK